MIINQSTQQQQHQQQKTRHPTTKYRIWDQQQRIRGEVSPTREPPVVQGKRERERERERDSSSVERTARTNIYLFIDKNNEVYK
jgi:hypothetical protein